MKAPLKLVCLMKQASQNRLISLTNLQGFTTLLAAVSMIKEQTEVYRGIVRTLARVVESVPVVYLENRPEQEAVQLVWENMIRDICHAECGRSIFSLCMCKGIDVRSFNDVIE